MNTLRVLLVDDEELSRLRLRTLVVDCVDPPAAVVGEAATAAAALHWLTHHRADVVLLDIHLPGIDGLQLAERLRALPQPPWIVFVTAHAEHALAAFEVEAVDYLTKPVRRVRLQAALQRVAQRLQGPTSTVAAALDTLPAPLPGPGGAGAAAPVIVVHERGELRRVPLADVLYLKAEQKYVTLRTARRVYLLDEPLAELEERLGERFLRIHRNALVARTAVAGLARRRWSTTAEGRDDDATASADTAVWAVRITPTDEWLAVSRRQLAAVREALAAEGV
jgi:two-component system response regulator AlgR